MVRQARKPLLSNAPKRIGSETNLSPNVSRAPRDGAYCKTVEDIFPAGLSGFGKSSSMICPSTSVSRSRSNMRSSSAGSSGPIQVVAGVRTAAAGKSRKCSKSGRCSSKNKQCDCQCCGGGGSGNCCCDHESCQACGQKRGHGCSRGCDLGCGGRCSHCISPCLPAHCTVAKPRMVVGCAAASNKAVDVFCPIVHDRCFLERELRNREFQLMYQREQMLLEQKLHHREQLLWDHEQFRTQQLLLRDRQFRYKVHQVSHDQDLHNRDLQIRGDRDEIMWARDMHQQDAITARARQQLLLQRDCIYTQEDEASKVRLKIYNKCCEKPLTCGEELSFIQPSFALTQPPTKKPHKKIAHIEIPNASYKCTPVIEVLNTCPERKRSGEHKEDSIKPKDLPKDKKHHRRTKHQESPPRSPDRVLLPDNANSPRQSRSEGKSKDEYDNSHRSLSRSKSTEKLVSKTYSPKAAKAEVVGGEHRKRTKGGESPNNTMRKRDTALSEQYKSEQSRQEDRKPRGPIYIEPTFTITSNPTSCDCECHLDVSYSTSDICAFCDCDVLEIQKNARRAAEADTAVTHTTNETSQAGVARHSTARTPVDINDEEQKVEVEVFSEILLTPPKPSEAEKQRRDEPKCRETSRSSDRTTSPSKIPYGVESSAVHEEPCRCAGGGGGGGGGRSRHCRRHRDDHQRYGCCTTRMPRDLMCCVNGNVSHQAVRRQHRHTKRGRSAHSDRQRAAGESGSRNDKRGDQLDVIFHNDDYRAASEAHAYVEKQSEHRNKARNKYKSTKRLSKQ